MKSLTCLRLFLVSSLLTACANVPPPGKATEAAIATVGPEIEAPTPIAHPTASPAAGNPLVGALAYSAEGDIYVMNADGFGRTRLTTDPAEDFDPVWAHDGAQIAFRSHRDGNEEVYLMQADGSDQSNLSNAPGTDYSPAWSPNGQWIAFNSDRAGNGDIWIIRPDGSGLRQITGVPGVSEYPTWSPDGNRIAFHCNFGRVLPNGTGDFEICVVNADGSGLVQLTDAPGESKLPAWSPDGSKIAFQTNRNGWPTFPGYVPLGYDSERFGDYEIYMMNIDGSGAVNLTNNPREDDEFPAWSREGHLVFSRYGCLMVMNAGGSGLAPIGSCQEGGQFPDWDQPAP